MEKRMIGISLISVYATNADVPVCSNYPFFQGIFFGGVAFCGIQIMVFLILKKWKEWKESQEQDTL